jgi:hypothetical protein
VHWGESDDVTSDLLQFSRTSKRNMATSHAEDQLGLVKVTRALISVSDKANLIEFAKSLAEHKVQA